ncbi:MULTISPECIES: type II toxin-antitoxin system RelE family toxin [Empedobacter]|uniref:type II toxin-antitoxin system RelE family toxin n=2 Tax=Weeksellaceae TaxID=2762318 RepID=UPI0025C3D549|nr:MULTISPECIES: type II toxin-antitoxin system RelE/ParE family toxin [Empedobacter]
MSYNIIATPEFLKEAKKLGKKYRSLKEDLAVLIEELQQNPTLGTALADNCYKIRLAIKSKGKGKSGGARVITHLFIENETIYLLSLYDKSEQNSISDKEIKDLLKLIK